MSRLLSRRASRIALLALAGWAWSPFAEAARDKGDDRLAAAGTQVESVSAAVESLERQVGPGRGLITQADAVRRYEDCVYLYLVGDYPMAAEGFFSLVTLAALTDAGLHRDAEWYLAESLFQMGNTSTAEARYLVIADDDEHPFREDAVRRLLELYALTGQTDQFAAFYKKEILGGRVTPSDLITYSLAKSFYFQSDLDEAVAHFERLGAESEFWGRARYFLGTIAVQRQDYVSALAYFHAAADATVSTPDQRKVQDLALLAIARVHYEEGHLPEAAEVYERIGGDSPYLADKLYEVVWTFIKQGQYREALEGVELFLINFPEHEFTAQMRLLDAHLRLEQHEYDDALGAYEKVVADYEPVRERFGDLSASESEQGEYFRQILAATDGQASDAGGLPGYAVAMMVGDPTMARALDVFREIGRQEEQIAASEAIIAELREVMSTAAGIGGYDRLRYEVAVERARTIDAQMELLSIEEEWLVAALPEDRLGEIDAGRRKRKDLVGLVGDMPSDVGSEESLQARREHIAALEAASAEVETLRARVETQRDALAAMRSTATGASGAATATRAELEARAALKDAEAAHDLAVADLEALRAAGPSTAWSDRLAEQARSAAASIDEARKAHPPARGGLDDPDGTMARIDRLQTTLASDQDRLGVLRTKLVEAESSELARIRARFDHEVREVDSQKADLGDTLVEAEEVSVVLTRAGFGRLEDFFAESVLRADMGVVDVYWSKKVDLADQRARMATEKAEMVQALSERFDRIREKLGTDEESP